MSNRQYVGARYVPKVVGEWDKSLSYEGLSIVTYNGNSFTSKKTVPSGIDISNAEYWINTGNYNAQIEYYRQETSNVTNKLTEEINNRESADNTLQNTINSEASARESADNTLQNNINSEASTRENTDNNIYNVLNNNGIVNDPIVVLISDSYGQYIEGDTYSWFPYFNEISGYNTKSKSKPGGSFGGGNGGVTYYQGLSELISDMTDDEKKRVTLVIIAGGYNDAMSQTSNETVINGINNCKDIISKSFPNNQKTMFFWIANSYVPSRKVVMYQYRRILRYLVNQCGLIYNDECYKSLHTYRTSMRNEGIHPTAEGAKNIGYDIFNVLNGGKISMEDFVELWSEDGLKVNHMLGDTAFIMLDLELTSSTPVSLKTLNYPLGYICPVNVTDFIVWGESENQSGCAILIRVTGNEDGTTSLLIRRADGENWTSLHVYNAKLYFDLNWC